MEIEYKWVFAVLLLLGTFILFYGGKVTFDQFFQVLQWIGLLIGIYEYGKRVGSTTKTS